MGQQRHRVRARDASTALLLFGGATKLRLCLKGHVMARTPAKAEIKYAVPIKVSRPRFKLSTAFANVDIEKICSKASVEIDVGSYEGDGCGRTVSAVVKKGKVMRLKVSPCAETVPIPVDASLKGLVAIARKKLGEKGKPSKFRSMNFAAFQQNATDITVTTITCVQICIWGHCFVCCTTPFGDILCGGGIIIHTP
jgi:hypothetical protein